MSPLPETNWQTLLERFTRVIGHKRYGELAEEMAELVQVLMPKYQNTDLHAWGSLLTLCLYSPNRSFGLDICWDWDKRMYYSYEVEIGSNEAKTPDDTFYPSMEDVLLHIEQYTGGDA